jgi:hypothetical protein
MVGHMVSLGDEDITRTENVTKASVLPANKDLCGVQQLRRPEPAGGTRLPCAIAVPRLETGSCRDPDSPSGLPRGPGRL